MNFERVSITKAGLENVDDNHVRQIIKKATEGTAFEAYEKKKQRRIQQRIDILHAQKAKLSESDIIKAEERMDQLAQQLELSERDLSRVIVCIDMDAFFASVEELKNPKLKERPMAVGTNAMLSTSNYAARKFGVRAAMPGFIARKLCPSLVIIPHSMELYAKISGQVQETLRRFDPHVEMVSLDEGFLDITHLVIQRQIDNPSEDRNTSIHNVTKEIRDAIYQTVDLTASAGIACSRFLAKICSNVNKPNGQFHLEPDVNVIKNFVRKLPVRKVPFIGAVQEKLLTSLSVVTCNDIYTNRGLLSLLFTPHSMNYYLRVSLGLGASYGEDDSASDSSATGRKSKSVETTFADTSDAAKLRDICRQLCEDLSEQLHEQSLRGHCITLKYRLGNYDVKSRCVSLDIATNDLRLITRHALRLLNQVMHQHIVTNPKERFSLRLLGVRVSSLIEQDTSTSSSGAQQQQQLTLSQCLDRRRRCSSASTWIPTSFACDEESNSSSNSNDTDFFDDVVPESPQKESTCSLILGTAAPTSSSVSNYASNTVIVTKCTQTQTGHHHNVDDENVEHSDKSVKEDIVATANNQQQQDNQLLSAAGESSTLTLQDAAACPVCGVILPSSQYPTIVHVTLHIDECLNAPVIRDILREQKSMTCNTPTSTSNKRSATAITPPNKTPTSGSKKKKKLSSAKTPSPDLSQSTMDRFVRRNNNNTP